MEGGARNFSDRELRISHPGVPCQSARKSLYQRADLPGSLEGGAGGCKQCGVLYHQEYPPEAAEGYKERIYPDCVGSRIQICRCPRGMSPWDLSVKIIKIQKRCRSIRSVPFLEIRVWRQFDAVLLPLP